MNTMLPRPRFWADAAAQLKTRRSLFGELLTLLLLYVIAYLVQSALLAVPVGAWVMGTQGDKVREAILAGQSAEAILLHLLETMPDWMVLAMLFSTGVLGAAAVVYCTRFQKRNLASMGLTKAGAPGEALLGLAVGLALFGAVLAIGLGTGGFTLAAGSPTGEQLGLSLAAFLGCLVQGAALELLVRGYFAPTVGARASVPFAVIFSALVTGMTQSSDSLFSMGGMNNLLLGLLLGIWTVKRGSLWGACALRGAWAFAGTVLFEVAPAAAHSSIRVFAVDADTLRPLLSGGQYGPMESICVTVVLLAAIAGALALPAKDPAEPEL